MSGAPNGHPVAELSAYLDGELGVAARAAVTAHLEECASCRALVDDLRALAEGARGELPPAPPDGLEARVRAALDGAEAAPRQTGWRLSRHLPYAAAASVLLLVAVAVLVRGDLAGRFGPPDAPTVTAAETEWPGSEDARQEAIGRTAEPETPAARKQADRLEAGAKAPLAEGSIERDQEREAAPSAASPVAVAPSAEPGDAASGDERFADADSLSAGVAEEAKSESARARRAEELTQEKETRADRAAGPGRPVGEGVASGDDQGADVAKGAAGRAPGPAPADEGARVQAADEAGYAGKQVTRELAVAPQRAPVDAPAPACATFGVPLAPHAVSVHAAGPEGVRAFLDAANGTGLGVTASRVDDGDVSGEADGSNGAAIEFLVPVQSWPAFRAWLLGRDDVSASLPPDARETDPAGARCVRLRAPLLPAPR